MAVPPAVRRWGGASADRCALWSAFAPAAAAGDTKKVSEHAAAIEARKSWLTEAQKALTDFSG